MNQPAVSDSADSSAASLLARVKQRGPEAWERLTIICGPVVYRWARVAGLQDHDAAGFAACGYPPRLKSYSASVSASTLKGSVGASSADSRATLVG